MGTVNCLTSNIGYQNEADAPLLHLIKSKNNNKKILMVNQKEKKCQSDITLKMVK